MRRSDRLEALAIITIAVLLALLIPVACAVGTTTYDRLRTAAGEERARNRQVTAVLTDAVPPPSASSTVAGTDLVERVQARWSADGVTHTGPVTADVGAKAGQTVAIWIDPAGDSVAAPRSSSGNAVDAVGVAVGVWALGSAGGVLFTFALHWQTDRYRRRQWQREWGHLDRPTGWSLN